MVESQMLERIDVARPGGGIVRAPSAGCRILISSSSFRLPTSHPPLPPSPLPLQTERAVPDMVERVGVGGALLDVHTYIYTKILKGGKVRLYPA